MARVDAVSGSRSPPLRCIPVEMHGFSLRTEASCMIYGVLLLLAAAEQQLIGNSFYEFTGSDIFRVYLNRETRNA
jgi:hypothetical protein